MRQAAITPAPATGSGSPTHVIVDSGTVTAVTSITNPVTVIQPTPSSLNASIFSLYQAVSPQLANAQTTQMQCDFAGSHFVKPYRRSQTVAAKSVITNSAVAVTALPAQAAGIFADISSLIVTVTPAATVSLPFTLTLSDGTATYVWDMETGALATSPADGTLLNLAFNPPLPATTTATAWTIATNVATVVVHGVVIAVLQKAS